MTPVWSSAETGCCSSLEQLPPRPPQLWAQLHLARRPPEFHCPCGNTRSASNVTGSDPTIHHTACRQSKHPQTGMCRASPEIESLEPRSVPKRLCDGRCTVGPETVVPAGATSQGVTKASNIRLEWLVTHHRLSDVRLVMLRSASPTDAPPSAPSSL